MAMRILVRMTEITDAPKLIDIEAAHIDSTIYVGEACMEYAEKFADMGARFRVPSTLNVSGLDEKHWMDWPVPQDWAEKAHRQMMAYKSMGAIQTWTCAPYQTEHRPKYGQQIAWGESNAIVFANSVIGARTERYPDLLDVCCAITGRVPFRGLHVTENRAGDFLIALKDVPVELQEADEFYPVLGHLVGKLSGELNPVIHDLKHPPNDDQYKALGAAAASSGTVGLFHVVGHTPEAQTLEDAFQGKTGYRQIVVGMAELRAARDELSLFKDERVDMVVLGSPHFSLEEFRSLEPLLSGRSKREGTEFLITTGRLVKQVLERNGMLEGLERFGAKLTVDTCPLATPMLPQSVKTLMTNSGKYAYYSPSLLGVQTVYGSTADCVESAVAGKVVRDDSLWR